MSPDYLYLHVPFCARRCSYCDFAVRATRTPPAERWLAVVEEEARRRVRSEGWRAPVTVGSVYVGGGTPSHLGAGVMAELRDRLSPWFRWDDATVEWTAEANPEDLDDALARDWGRAGVNRVSLGVQTFHEPALRWLGRPHEPEDSARAVKAARAHGIRNVSVDLLFGLPERLGRSWTDDVERALALEPTHVSLYGLTAETGTPLGRRVRDGREPLPGGERYDEEYLWVAGHLRSLGYRHYEVSNFARPGSESRHTRAYWTGEAYVGLGPGAHSFLPPVRRWNIRDWHAYRVAVEAGEEPVGGEERVEGDAASLERIWLGLRTARGLPMDGLGPGPRARVRQWIDDGRAEEVAGRVRLTPRGWLRLDDLAVALDDAAGKLRLDDAAPAGSHSESYET